MSRSDTATQTSPASATQSHPLAADIFGLLSFRLARVAAMNDRVGQDWVSREYDLTIGSWRVLGVARALEPAPLSDIRSALEMDKGQLSRIVKRLVERGLLSSERSHADQRVLMISLTPKGRELYSRLFSRAFERNQQLVVSLTDEEVDALFGMLDKLQGIVEQRMATRGER